MEIQESMSSKEKKLTLIWENVFGVTDIDAETNFFSLGGHSLMAVEMLGHIKKEFKSTLKLKDIFEAPTIRTLLPRLFENIENSIKIETPLFVPENVKRIPLCSNQYQAWYMNSLNGSSTTHNLPMAIRLKQTVNRACLERTLNFIIARHSVLRTSVKMHDGLPCQHISERVTIELEEVKILETEIAGLLNQESQCVFDLTQAPLVKSKLIKLDENDYVFFFMAHHIIWDGWSFEIFLEELDLVYSAFMSEAEPALAPLTEIAYSDFSLLNNNLSESNELDHQLSFWKEKLASPLPVLELPLDHIRQKIRKYHGESVNFELSDELVVSLKLLAKSQETSLYNIFLTAYKITMSLYTQVDDIIVGTPVMGRYAEEFNSTLGFFANTVALRSNILVQESFSQNLIRVSKTCIDSFDNQEIPYEKVLQALKFQRDFGHSPVFQTFFSYQDLSSRKNSFDGNNYEFLNTNKASSHTDIDMSIITRKSKIVGTFEFRTDLFERVSIERFKDFYLNLLQIIVFNPEKSILKLPLLPESQIAFFNEINDRTKVSLPECTVSDLIEKSCQKFSRKVAVISVSTELQYEKLDKLVNQFATALSNAGYTNRDLIGVSLPRDEYMLVTLLSIWKIGATYVPLDPSFPQDRLDFMAETSQLKGIISNQEIAPRFNSEIPVVFLDELISFITETTYENDSPISLNDPAYVLYTSGSTGKPKGVEISQRNVLNFLTSMERTPGMNSQNILLAVASSSFDISVLELFLPLIVGGTVVIASKEECSDGDALKRIIEKEKVDVMQGTPSTWRLLLSVGWRGSENFKILCGGEVFPKDLSQKLLSHGSSVWNVYGPTETTVWSTCKQLHMQDEFMSIGFPIQNTEVLILGSDNQMQPIGVIGELFIGGSGVALSYKNRPELTAERFIDHPYKKDEKVYRTGDLARFHHQGELECLGRNDGQVKVRGYRIELGEIEVVLASDPLIKESVVIPLESKGGDTRLVAYIVTQNGTKIDTKELRTRLNQALPAYMVPAHFMFLEKFPKTLTHKIDKKNLPSPFDVTPKSFVALEENKESVETMLNIWKELLNLEEISVTDNFFDIGGYSLLSVQLFAKIFKVFKVDLPLSTLLEAPTLIELCKIVDKKVPMSTLANEGFVQFVHSKIFSSLVPIRPVGNLTPLFCVHGVGGNVLNYLRLCPFIGTNRPLYGLQSLGVDGVSTPLKTVEEMARAYIIEIQTVQPHGPYLISGGSMGGIIALEIAGQLKASGESIDKLIMFDSYGPDIVDVDKVSKINFMKTLPESILYRSKCYWTMLRVFLQKFVGLPISHYIRYFNIEMINYQALNNNQPKAYAGDLFLIRAPIAADNWHHDPLMGWKETIQGKIKTFFVNGNHNQLIESPEFGPTLQKILAEKAY